MIQQNAEVQSYKCVCIANIYILIKLAYAWEKYRLLVCEESRVIVVGGAAEVS